MRERKDRRWGVLTTEEVQAIADNTPFEKYSKSGFADGEYMPKFTDELAGKKIVIKCDNGDVYTYEFEEGMIANWSCNGGEVHKERAQIVPASDEPGMYFMQHYCDKSIPPTAHTLVLDFNTGLTTICVAQLGNQFSAREVSRKFLFGIMDGYAECGWRHKFTDEMVGNAIYWTYKEEPKVRIKHIYTAPKYYTYQMIFGEDKCWVASNPADYLKINDHMYVFAFIEERQTGAQGFFLINMNTLHDVGAFFSINATGIDCAVVGAKGKLTDPYAFDWCESETKKKED